MLAASCRRIFAQKSEFLKHKLDRSPLLTSVGVLSLLRHLFNIKGGLLAPAAAARDVVHVVVHVVHVARTDGFASVAWRRRLGGSGDFFTEKSDSLWRLSVGECLSAA